MHPDSYSTRGIVNPKGVVISKSVLPGLANATSHFQSTIEPLFSGLRNNMKAWLDDLILHAVNESTLLDKLEAFIEIFKSLNLFLSAKKCVLFSREIRWCGRVVSSAGYRMDSAKVSGLRNMDSPRTAEELSRFLHFCRWMSVRIPNFAQCAAPLQEMLEQAYSTSGKRTKRSIKRLLTKELGWGSAHEQAFPRIQDCLRKAVTSSYPDPEKVRCVFTDASQNFWAGVVRQTTREQLRLPVPKQRHELITFIAAAFKVAQGDWKTFEKEGFAIFQTFLKVDYLLQGQGQSHIYTDHCDLFVVAPLALEPALGRHIVSKVQHWALYLSLLPYVIEHADGVDNVCACRHMSGCGLMHLVQPRPQKRL